jgi:hypothetical protein
VIGVDPGETGGWAHLAPAPSGWQCIHLGRWSQGGPAGAVEYFKTLDPDNVLIGIELVSSSPAQRPKVAFNFGGNFHSWLMMFRCLDLTWFGFRPQTWQKDIPGIKRLRLENLSFNQKYTKRKRLIKQWIEDKYECPTRLVLETADALAIAHYVTTTVNKLPS